ncbi:hypothetical protein [Novosphingobium album (ex Liu et al. 2023)]|uniref:DUF2946 domain-containing protein n=1 Tax=Novosphingobium album (ex Liu et al. 2023) TaxID=3031130 RepID=A0ABT5WTY8_9SPHN|nr:hypothetical protein [Novosphingobium album (ex Liu et al. 2023)]MDE8653339.1 hypothetical protein [Novosphingobium album (ex Liu et al. 2023)]
MIRRVLTLLLVVCLTLPALAMSGHGMAMPAPRAPAVHAMGHDAGHRPTMPQAERKDCIGCVTPLRAEPALSDSADLSGARYRFGDDRRFVAALAAPETPPPRA